MWMSRVIAEVPERWHAENKNLHHETSGNERCRKSCSPGAREVNAGAPSVAGDGDAGLQAEPGAMRHVEVKPL